MVSKEDLIDYLNNSHNIKLMTPQVLVGKKTLEEIAEESPTVWNELMYLRNEWDITYLTTEQVAELWVQYGKD
jgi:uncharacterized Fe-S radical SAM superfamily protein PflX